MKYSSAIKSEIIGEYQAGKSVQNLVSEYNVPRSTIYAWIKAYKNSLNTKREPISLRDYSMLKRKTERQERIIHILQVAPCTATARLQERLNAIENLSGEYNVNTLCEALCVAKGTYYNHILRNKRDQSSYAKRRNELKPIIQKIFYDSKQVFGAGKITAILKDRGYRISDKTVSELMHEMGLFTIRTSAKTLYLMNEEIKKENILKRNFHADMPNQVWVSDVTYFKFRKFNYYICVIIDLFSRKVVACRISTKNSTQLVKSTFKAAYEARRPAEGLIFHTDRGSNYISHTFMAYLNGLGVKQSFSQKGTPYDNAVCETFFANMKREELYRTQYRSEKEFFSSVRAYIEFFNVKRPHEANRYKTPERYEEVFALKHEESGIV